MFQSTAIPSCKERSRFIRALAKLKQPLTGRGAFSNAVVHQNEFSQARVVVCGFWKDFRIREPLRLWSHVAIKRRAGDGTTAGPEAYAADLVGIGLSCDGIGFWPLRRPASGEACNREIEASPEKMHRA